MTGTRSTRAETGEPSAASPDEVQPRGTATTDSGSPRGKKPARLSLNISRATEEALLELMDEKSISMTEAVRRLIGYGAVINRAIRDGGEVLIRRNGQTERVVLLD